MRYRSEQRNHPINNSHYGNFSIVNSPYNSIPRDCPSLNYKKREKYLKANNFPRHNRVFLPSKTSFSSKEMRSSRPEDYHALKQKDLLVGQEIKALEQRSFKRPVFTKDNSEGNTETPYVMQQMPNKTEKSEKDRKAEIQKEKEEDLKSKKDEEILSLKNKLSQAETKNENDQKEIEKLSEELRLKSDRISKLLDVEKELKETQLKVKEISNEKVKISEENNRNLQALSKSQNFEQIVTNAEMFFAGNLKKMELNEKNSQLITKAEKWAEKKVKDAILTSEKKMEKVAEYCKERMQKLQKDFDSSYAKKCEEEEDEILKKFQDREFDQNLKRIMADFAAKSLETSRAALNAAKGGETDLSNLLKAAKNNLNYIFKSMKENK